MLKLKYFVLKPEGRSLRAAASRYAMQCYADYIKASDPILAEELKEWSCEELQKSNKTISP